MRLFLSCFLFLATFQVFSQEKTVIENAPKVKIDSLYREDQFYFGITYNTLRDTPEGFSKGKIATGFSGGFLRDMPLNTRRNVAIASGVGLAYNNYNQNIAVSGSSEVPVYTVMTTDYSKNKFSQLLVEVPLEFRWRTSTYEAHKFWRIYGGLKCSYLVYDKSVFNSGTSNTVITGNKDFNKLTYGAYISSGYNTLNVYAYYGLNPIFKSAKTSTENLVMKSFNFGIIFYIL